MKIIEISLRSDNIEYKYLIFFNRQLHLSLCITSRETNKAFSKQVTMQMASMFIMLCGFLYSSYLFYKEPKIPTNRKIQHCTMLLFFIILGFSFMVYIIRTLVMTTAEVFLYIITIVIIYKVPISF